MAKKKTSAKKKNTEQLRNDAIKDIDARLNGDATPAERGRKAKGGKATKTEKAPKEKKVRKLSGLDLAAQVLTESKEPLNAKMIFERDMARSQWAQNSRPLSIAPLPLRGRFLGLFRGPLWSSSA